MFFQGYLPVPSVPMPKISTPKIYTRTGDDGTTGLLFGKRVPKDHPMIEANGAVDEAQAVIGVARAEAERGSELDSMLVELEREMWVLMSEIATAPEDRSKLQAGKSLVTAEMVLALEERIDDLKARTDVPADFVVPGQDRTSALLDQARTVVRRAERLFISGRKATEPGGSVPDDSMVGQYLNRLSDLLWTAARWQEGVHQLARQGPRRGSKVTAEGAGPD
jgi:cob(I)alamin adenosyltransferase